MIRQPGHRWDAQRAGPAWDFIRSRGTPILVALKVMARRAKPRSPPYRSTSPTTSPTRSQQLAPRTNGGCQKEVRSWRVAGMAEDARADLEANGAWAPAHAARKTSAAAPSEIDEELAGSDRPVLRKAGLAVGIFFGGAHLPGCFVGRATTSRPLRERILSPARHRSALKSPAFDWPSVAFSSEPSA